MAPPTGAAQKGPPVGPLVAISVMYVSNALAETVLLPFAPLMVQSFNVTEDETKLGYYAGLLASSFYFGMLLSSSAWGTISDYIGRKPVLLIGMLNNTICALVFGFSTSLPMAMSARFVNGLLTGIYPVGRTAMSELCTAANQAAGFSLLSLNWGVGLLLGPAIGGVLSSPVSKYPSLFPADGLFGRFAFLLPCLVLSGFSFVSILFIIFMLPETLGRAKALGTKPAKAGGQNGSAAAAALENGQASAEGLSEPLLQGQGQGRGVGVQRQSSAIQVVGSAGRSIPNDALGLAAAGSYESVRSQSVSSPSTWLLLREGEGAPKLTRKASGAQLATAGVRAEGAAAAAYAASVAAKEEAQGSSGDLRGGSSGGGSSRRGTAGLPVSISSPPEAAADSEENVSVWSALTESDTIFAALIFATLGFTITAQNEVFPLWGLTPWRFGGLDFHTSAVGLCQAAGGLSMIPFQLFVYHRIVGRFGPLNTLRIGLVSMMPLIFFPAARLFLDPTQRVLAAMFFMIWRSASVTIVFTTCVVLVINSVKHPRFLGTVNGVSQTLMMSFEAIAPAAGGSIYAWSIGKGQKFPTDYHFFWILWFLLCCAMFLLSLCLSQHINYRKFETNDPEEELEDENLLN